MLRLELARTPDFPNGSAGRAYLLRLPLDEKGTLDEKALRANPGYATVLRQWPNEPDQSGYLVHKPRGWAFSYALGDEDDENLYHLETHSLRLGDYVTITEANGEKLPFRVAHCEG